MFNALAQNRNLDECAMAAGVRYAENDHGE
jgi:hypothetical protein